ncbi:MAG: PAS domain-containing protein, partial [Oscillospiraceae bacterium]
MKSKVQKLFAGVLLGLAIGAIVHIFWREHDLSMRLSVVAAILLFGVLIAHAANESRRIRKALRNERDHLRDILDHIPLPLFIADSDRRLNFVNTAALELFACTEEILGKPCCGLHTGICNTPQCAIEQMERTGNGRTYYEAEGKSYRVSTAALEPSAVATGRYVELIEDITEVVEAKKLLEEKTIELETMSENLAGGV